MVKTSRGLGRGISALISDERVLKSLELSQDGAGGASLEEIELDKLQPNPDQPRKHFARSSLDELASSIKEHGVIQPIVVTKTEQNSYSIIAGERRWRAAKIAGLERVPVVVRTASELQKLELALLENVQRQDLTPLEQALSVQKLHEQFAQSYQQIAKRLGKAYPTVINMVRLLQLPDSMQESLHTGKISEGHARALLALKDEPELQIKLHKLIVTNHWSVRQAEQFVVANREKKTNTTTKIATESKETKSLSQFLNVPVRLRRSDKGGNILISFSDDQQLHEIIKKLVK